MSRKGGRGPSRSETVRSLASMFSTSLKKTYVWRTDEVKQRAELPFSHQPSLQSCDDGLIGETSQRGTGSIELALPRWEQLEWCELFSQLEKSGGTYGFHEFLLTAAGNSNAASTLALTENRVLGGPECNFGCIFVGHLNKDMTQGLALPVEQDVGTDNGLLQPADNHRRGNVLWFA